MRQNYFTEMCSGSEAGSYSRLKDFVYHSTLGLRVIKGKKSERGVMQPQNKTQANDMGIPQTPRP